MKITKKDIDGAVKENIISNDQSLKLMEYFKTRTNAGP